tara:strand:+ start:991 stop:1512 length:522 start_codon:yes stop_codon:yes gene_type:complete
MHVRARLELPLKFIAEDEQNGTGKSLNVSGNGIQFITREQLNRGDYLVCYIKDLGRLCGYVTRSKGGKVSLVFDASAMKRDRIADQITWLINKDQLGLNEERRSERHAASGELIVTCQDGRTMSCQVADMSLVGVALLTEDPRPFVGERVTFGNKSGTVARFIDGGFAVDFRL